MSRITLAAWIGSLAVLGGMAAAATAQDLPPKSYMSKNVFYLPVKVEDRVRGNLREVQLYSKDNPSKNWVLGERATPGQTYFTFRAPHDGEYWFTVVIVDKGGHPIPGDIRKEPPSLIVVLDTQQPDVDVQPVSAPSGEGICFRCIVKDDNADPSKTRFFYQTGDSMWQAVSHMSNHADRYCIPAQAMFSGMVKVEACDLAGNTVTREFNMGSTQKTLATTQEPVDEPAGPAKNIAMVSTPDKSAVGKTLPMTVESMSTKSPAPFPVDQVSGPDIEPPRAQAAKTSSNSGLLPTEARIMPKSGPSDPALEKGMSINPGPVSTSQKPSMAARHLVNKNHIFLQYQIDNSGPSGVGKIEVWVTRDKGQTWQKQTEDHKQFSNIEIDLPGEGIFGVRLVVSNGRGFGATPPAPGDSPDWWIEVDTTKPAAELRGLKMGSGTDSGCVFISWSAQDKNLARDPIDLYFALAPDGPWQPIAQNLRNDGQYCWHMPAYLGTEAFVRLVAHDAAGNAAIVDCPQPVPLDDMSRPRGRLTGVSTVAPLIINETSVPQTSSPQTVDSRK